MLIKEKQIVQVLFEEQVKLLSFLVLIVRNEHAAEDLCQEVAMKAVENRPKFESLDHLRAWLYRTAKNQALNYLKKACQKDISLDSRLANVLCVEYGSIHTSDMADSIQWLRQCLGRLAPSAAHLVGLRYGEGLSGQAISARLRRSEDAVYQALSRIRRALSKCIREQTDTEGTPA